MSKELIGEFESIPTPPTLVIAISRDEYNEIILPGRVSKVAVYTYSPRIHHDLFSACSLVEGRVYGVAV